MVWLCGNGHEVQEGMFVCPACGSDKGHPGRFPIGEHDQPPSAMLRQRVERELTRFIVRGVVFVVLSLLIAFVSGWLAAEANEGGSGFFAMISWALGVAGAAYLLCGVIGWGVKYGNEATTARDGGPAGQT